MTQAKLFEPASFPSEPWEIPANVKRVSMKDWVRENAVEIANAFCKERPNYSFLDNDLVREFRLGIFPINAIREWAEKKYQEAIQRV